MDEFDGSLHAQHAQIDWRLQAIVAAGLARRWSEYRVHFGALQEGLLQHMAFEEEVVFPVLEASAAAAVKELYEQHARVRQHLDVLAAAAAEQDPEGCLAELGQLADLLQAHHAAEIRLDPQYVQRRMPPPGPDRPPALDLRGLQPPEPIVRILDALERAPRQPLRVILPHEPVPLYGLLRERGFVWSGAPREGGGYELLIDRD